MVGDLTSLANVKAWRSPAIAATADDAILTREISAASDAVRQYLSRDLIPQSYTDCFDGSNTQQQMLPQFPVIDVTALSINGVTIPKATAANVSGYVFDGRNAVIKLRGYVFRPGMQNVQVDYRAGYLAPTEVKTVATAGSGGSVSTTALTRAWVSDEGVSYSDGSPLVAVDQSPAQGQYVAPSSPGGAYLFNSGDVGTALAFSYGYVPRDVEEVVIQMVILEYNRRDRIGQNSKSLAGESVSYYTSAGMTPMMRERLNQYRAVCPVP